MEDKREVERELESPGHSRREQVGRREGGRTGNDPLIPHPSTFGAMRGSFHLGPLLAEGLRWYEKHDQRTHSPGDLNITNK